MSVINGIKWLSWSGLLAVLAVLIDLASCQTRQDFIQAMLVEYDSRIPPNFEKDYPCEVNVSLFINSIDSIDEQTMDFTLSTFVSQEWRDTRLRFMNLIDEEYLELDSRLMENVWVPDLYFRNEKRAYFHTVTIPNKMLHIYKDGTVKYRSRMTLTASCPMKLHKYPMDTQLCQLFIQSYIDDNNIDSAHSSLSKNQTLAYSTNRLTFRWQNIDPVRLNRESELPQFTLDGVNTENCTDLGEGNTCIRLDLHLKRNIGFYMIQTYIPTVLIVTLSWLSFWLHVDAVPARVSLGILTVLTVTTQRSMSSASLPRVSYVKAIDVWMAACLCFVFAALLEYACVNCLARHRQLQIEGLQNQFTECRNGLLSDKCVNVLPYRIRDNAQAVDNISKIAFPATFLVFCLAYWIIYICV